MAFQHQKIKKLRERAGLTQEQAADAADLGSRQRWNDIESGRRANLTIEVIDRVAKALGVTARDLVK